jgi:hypothetical protein
MAQNSQKAIGVDRTLSRAVKYPGMALRIHTPILRLKQMRFGRDTEF